MNRQIYRILLSLPILCIIAFISIHSARRLHHRHHYHSTTTTTTNTLTTTTTVSPLWNEATIADKTLKLDKHSTFFNTNPNNNNNASKAAAAAAPLDTLPLVFKPTIMIPMQLWQTFPNKSNLPDKAIHDIKAWSEMNPELKMHMHDDEEAEAFIAAHFNEDVLQVYKSFPLGVMRADFWRYAVVYVNGGIYADVDVLCKRPVKEWFVDAGKTLDLCEDGQCSWENCSMVVGGEWPVARFVAQWSFAGVKGHPLLYTVIQKILTRAKQGIDLSTSQNSNTAVHYYTGPGVWTDAVAELLGTHTYPNVRFPAIVGEYQRNKTVRQRAKDLGICLTMGDFYKGFNVYNEAASIMWKGKKEKDYPNWRNSLKEIKKQGDADGVLEGGDGEEESSGGGTSRSLFGRKLK